MHCRRLGTIYNAHSVRPVGSGVTKRGREETVALNVVGKGRKTSSPETFWLTATKLFLCLYFDANIISMWCSFAVDLLVVALHIVKKASRLAYFWRKITALRGWRLGTTTVVYVIGQSVCVMTFWGHTSMLLSLVPRTLVTRVPVGNGPSNHTVGRRAIQKGPHEDTTRTVTPLHTREIYQQRSNENTVATQYSNARKRRRSRWKNNRRINTRKIHIRCRVHTRENHQL